MSRTRILYLPVLVALLVFLLAGSAHAEVSCEDMPCCSQTSATVEASCLSCGPSGCACELDTSQPFENTKVGLVLTNRFELGGDEIRLLVLPEPRLPDNAAPEFWSAEVLWHSEQDFVSYSSFPNPPPPVS